MCNSKNINVKYKVCVTVKVKICSYPYVSIPSDRRRLTL